MEHDVSTPENEQPRGKRQPRSGPTPQLGCFQAKLHQGGYLNHHLHPPPRIVGPLSKRAVMLLSVSHTPDISLSPAGCSLTQRSTATCWHHAQSCMHRIENTCIKDPSATHSDQTIRRSTSHQLIGPKSGRNPSTSSSVLFVLLCILPLSGITAGSQHRDSTAAELL